MANNRPIRKPGRVCAEYQDALDTPRSATRGVEIVYYLRLPDGLIKIGTSAEPLDRLARHRRDKGATDVLAIEFGGRALERERHEQFAHLRDGRHEHFAPEPDLLAHIDYLRAGLGLAG